MARVKRYRDQLERAQQGGVGRGRPEVQSKESAVLELMQGVAMADLDVEERHIAMDALLCAYAPAPVADMFAAVRRWYS